MSLQVWLPLNGNLKNQGLNNINITGSGYTNASQAKLSTYCIKTTTASSIDLLYDGGCVNTGSISFGAWFKFHPSEIGAQLATLTYPTSGAIYPTGNLIGNGSYGGIGLIWMANNQSASDTFTTFTVYAAVRSSTNGAKSTPQYTVPFDTWVHMMFVFDRSTKKCFYYINGTLFGTVTNTDFNDAPTRNLYLNWAGVWGGSGPGARIPFRCQDLRIYDTALSSMEVHEIYKANILHLKLSDNYNSITNAYNYPTFDNSAAAAGWLHWGPTGHLGTYGQNTDSKYIYYPNQTYSHWIAEGNPIGTSGKYYICYQSPAFEGGYRSVQFIIKEQNSLPITNNICVPSWNGKVTGTTPMTEWTEIVPLGNGFYLCKCDGFQQTGSDDLVSILVFAGYKIYITQAVLENDKKMCSDIFRQENLTAVGDCSGYGHNAITNAITSLPESARYRNSAVFNGSSSYVKVTDTGWMVDGADQITINFWAKASTWPATTRIISCTEGGGWNIEPGNSGYYRVPMHVYTNTSGSVGYTFDSNEFKISDLPTNEWVMLTITYNKDTGHKTYINGTLHHSYTNVNYGLHYAPTASRLYLGCESNGVNPGTPYWAGQMGDFRIYAVELTDKEIMELYNESSAIDRNGNIYAREVVEQ